MNEVAGEMRPVSSATIGAAAKTRKVASLQISEANVREIIVRKAIILIPKTRTTIRIHSHAIPIRKSKSLRAGGMAVARIVADSRTATGITVASAIMAVRVDSKPIRTRMLQRTRLVTILATKGKLRLLRLQR